MNKNFIIQKVKEKKTDTSPDYNIKMKSGDDFVYIGAAWVKKDKNGSTYLSCKFQDESEYNGSKRAGYHIGVDRVITEPKTEEDIMPNFGEEVPF